MYFQDNARVPFGKWIPGFEEHVQICLEDLILGGVPTHHIRSFTDAGTAVEGKTDTYELRGAALSAIRDKIQELLQTAASGEIDDLPQTLTLLHGILKSIPNTFWKLDSLKPVLDCGVYFAVLGARNLLMTIRCLVFKIKDGPMDETHSGMSPVLLNLLSYCT